MRKPVLSIGTLVSLSVVYRSDVVSVCEKVNFCHDWLETPKTQARSVNYSVIT